MASAEVPGPRLQERLLLSVRRIYVLPTRFGWLWLAGAALLQVVGIQLQSNGALLMSFLLLGLFLLTLHLTVFNLLGLELSCAEPEPGFAGSPLPYPLWVTSRCPRFGVELELQQRRRPPGLFQAAGSGSGRATGRTLEAGRHLLTVAWTPTRRGRQRPGWLRLRSTAPLGLFRAWSVWEPAIPQLVYPARRNGPVQERPIHPDDVDPSVRRLGGGTGDEEWTDLRPHRREEGAARLAWKTLARGGGAYAKQFAARPSRELLLAPAAEVPLEEALEHLCDRICSLSASGAVFGLSLPGRTVAPGSGPRQRERCLQALALLP
jgi:uncharacterized protein (DUF58 family)